MNYHYIDAVCEDTTYGRPYSTPPGWFNLKGALVLDALETPQDMYEGTIITPIVHVGPANRSKLLGNTNAVVYNVPECHTLGF